MLDSSYIDDEKCASRGEGKEVEVNISDRLEIDGGYSRGRAGREKIERSSVFATNICNSSDETVKIVDKNDSKGNDGVINADYSGSNSGTRQHTSAKVWLSSSMPPHVTVSTDRSPLTGPLA